MAIDENLHGRRVGAELQDAEAQFTSGDFDFTSADPRLDRKSWAVASKLVGQFKPVPSLIWVITRSVFGRSDKLGEPDPMTFSNLAPLMQRAALDPILAGKDADEKIPGTTPPLAPTMTLTQSVNIIGKDVAASLAFIHAIGRRVSSSLAERVSRAILDDALLRASIGLLVGRVSPTMCGPGRGMLAGFAGRCGLALQMSTGNLAQAQEALQGLAGGKSISEICTTIYGCDPLQVAAMALIAGGCSRDIALGIAAYNLTRKPCAPGSDQYRWLSLFTIIENLRMNTKDQIDPSYWKELGIDPYFQDELSKEVLQRQRRGHKWRWIVQPQEKTS